MAKKINKTKLVWRGRGVFLAEFFRALRGMGSLGVHQFLTLLSLTMKNERLVEHDGRAVVQLFIPPIPSRSFSRYLRSYTNNLVFRKRNLHLGTVLIAVTSRCPYKCWYCSAGNTPDGEPSQDDIERTLRLLTTWGTSIIGFTGGEPLLRDDIDDIIRRYSGDYTFMIFSSGYGLDRERANRLKQKGLFSIAISLDDYRQTKHDKARGFRGAYKNSLAAIENAKRAGLYTILQSVITQELLENGRMWNFFDFVQETGADELLLLEPLGTGNLMHDNGYQFLSHGDHQKLKWFHDASHDHPTLPKINSFADFEDRTRFGCGAGFQHAYVDVNGNLWPCNFLPISLGNVNNETGIIEMRLKKYFSRPCSTCILKTHRSELQRLSSKGLPIPFSEAERFLRAFAKASQRENPPSFYASFNDDDGQVFS